MNKKRATSCALVLLTVLLLVSSITACKTTVAPKTTDEGTESPSKNTETGEKKNVKMAFIFSTSVNDGGWITGHDIGRQACDELPGVETTYLDNIPESNGWKYINDFAEQGYDIILPCSYGYMEDTADVASKHPNVVFEHCSGYLTSDNMGNYFGKDYEATFLLGMACGACSKSNSVGYVVSYPTPQVLRNINAFALGAKLANPDAVCKVAWALTWYDPTLEREATESLLAAGCDAIGSYMNSPVCLQTTEKAGAVGTGSQADMSAFAPDAHLGSQTWDWSVLYKYFALEVQKGTWKPESIFWGMKEGLVDITSISEKVPSEARTMIEDYHKRLKDGDESASPFFGEVKDQDGKVRIEGGRDATLEEILSMDYLVENVQGEIPTS